jgi:hypothetical protein
VEARRSVPAWQKYWISDRFQADNTLLDHSHVKRYLLSIGDRGNSDSVGNGGNGTLTGGRDSCPLAQNPLVSRVLTWCSRGMNHCGMMGDVRKLSFHV